MPGPEAEFYGRVRDALKGSVHFERIENTALPGMPDTDASRNGHIVKVEFKVIVGTAIHMETFQNAWFMRNAMDGGNAKILAKTYNGVVIWGSKSIPKFLQYGVIKIRGMGRKSPNYGCVCPKTRFRVMHEEALYDVKEEDLNWGALADAIFT